MKKTKDRIVSIIALLVTVLYPCLFMYFQNVDEGNFKEILPAGGKVFIGYWNCIYPGAGNYKKIFKGGFVYNIVNDCFYEF